MGIDIYYFSGTGNSLHVAKELQRRMPEVNLIPMVSLLNKDIIETTADSIGFVFPIYNLLLPVPVIKFLKKADFRKSKYIFAIATRAQSPERAILSVEKKLKRKGRNLDSSFVVTMGGNCEGSFSPVFPTKEVVSNLESQLQNKLDYIQKILMSQEKYREKDNPPFKINELAGSFAAFIMPLLSLFGEKLAENTNISINYYSDPTCKGCGICEKVCLSKKIKIADNKPVWQKSVKCFLCFSCFNYCPSQSIMISNSSSDADKIKRYTDKSRRYHHPEISANDISLQKSNHSLNSNLSCDGKRLNFFITRLIYKIIHGRNSASPRQH
jgi:NAD-dependent dihydropyrimidine dehydrogenase PreA subunit